MDKTFKNMINLMMGNSSTSKMANTLLNLFTESGDTNSEISSRNCDNDWNDKIKKAFIKAKFCGECEAAQPISVNTGFLSAGKRWCICHSREVDTVDSCK